MSDKTIEDRIILVTVMSCQQSARPWLTLVQSQVIALRCVVVKGNRGAGGGLVGEQDGLDRDVHRASGVHSYINGLPDT